jgi:hypothetical protein
MAYGLRFLRNAFLAVGLAAACKHDPAGPGTSIRGFRMGFSAFPPRADTAILIPTLTLSAQHSDAGLIQLSIPWTTLLGGIPADSEVRIVRLPLVNYYRGTNHTITVALDVTDGLNRAAEDPQLVAAGRSITEPAIQRMYLDYVGAVDSILHPEYLSLAAETNLIRAAAPAPVYAAVVAMTNAAAGERRAAHTTARLLVSVQVETAWGALGGGGAYVGIAQDRTDFPFLDALGLSSYPYLGGYQNPEDIPLDYYSRLVLGQPLPMLVLEGGWPSVNVGAVSSTAAEQARYLHQQRLILDSAHAVGLFQITFTDLDLVANPPPPGSGLPLFAYNGLVDTALHAKLALAAWDSILALPLRP